jgi:methionyl-tRNA formyltransferase
MRITLVGSRHFGVTTLNMLREHGVQVARIVVHDGEDRLATAGRAFGIEVIVQANPKLVTASEIAPDTDLIVTAHSHARVSREALAASRLGGIGYHPSLLPRHPGIAAVEWTIKVLGQVIDYAKVNRSIPAKPQDEQFATKAPSLS